LYVSNCPCKIFFSWLLWLVVCHADSWISCVVRWSWPTDLCNTQYGFLLNTSIAQTQYYQHNEFFHSKIDLNKIQYMSRTDFGSKTTFRENWSEPNMPLFEIGLGDSFMNLVSWSSNNNLMWVSWRVFPDFSILVFYLKNWWTLFLFLIYGWFLNKSFDAQHFLTCILSYTHTHINICQRWLSNF